MLESKAVHFLHVEDDDLCIMALARALKKANVKNPVNFAHDGIEALDMLRGTNGRERLPRPCLILLDLNMPRMGGIELLKELRQDAELSRTIVFVMTTSRAERDRNDAYNLGVAGYILKTHQNAFVEAASLLESYCRVIELPT